MENLSDLTLFSLIYVYIINNMQKYTKITLYTSNDIQI